MGLVPVFLFILFLTVSYPDPKEPVIFHVKYSQEDLVFGRTLDRIFEDIKKNRLNQKVAQRLYSASKKTTAFSDYKELAEALYKISRIGRKDFHRSCSISMEEKESYIQKKLKKAVIRHCRHLFIKMLLKSKKNIDSKGLDYLKYALPFYLKGEDFALFIRYFRKIPSRSTLHRLISHYITDAYMENNIQPHQKILSRIKINAKLTRHIQKVGLDDKKRKRFFIREFRNILNKFKMMIDQKKYNLADMAINEALKFYDKNKKFISRTLAWKTFLFAGRDFLYNGKSEKSIELFRYSFELAEDKEQRYDSLFHMIWPHILEEEYEKSIVTMRKYKMLEKFIKLDSRLQYWMAHAFDKSGKNRFAEKLFDDLITYNPLSFYSIISLKRINEKDPKKVFKRIKTDFISSPSLDFIRIDSYTSRIKNSIKRLMVWLEVDQDEFSSIEVLGIVNTKKENGLKDQVFQKKLTEEEYRTQLTMNVTHLLTRKEKFLQTFKVLYGSLNARYLKMDKQIMEQLFPFQYLNQIEKITSWPDPLLILALIRQESAFNPEAQSVAGARGLMQLMPNTARRFKRRLNKRKLHNPDLNLNIGIRYLKQLIRKYNGNMVYTLAAYNAGEGRIKRWRKKIFVSDDPLLMIESIPFKETRYYVKLIYRNIFFYNLLKKKPSLDIPLEESFQIEMTSRDESQKSS